MAQAAPAPVTEIAGLASLGTMPALLRQLSGLGGCTRPIRLDGHRSEVHTGTGELLHLLASTDLPAGHLLVRCNNRRATRCSACAETYRRDTFHLITAGLRGGKGIPEQVAAHPRVFATFTAPSFGPVHNRPNGKPCRCGVQHAEDDPALGTPLSPDRYDFSTKSRRYSTTLGALRDARAEWRRAQTNPEPVNEDTTLVLAHWSFAGVGLTPAETWLASTLTPAPGTEGEPTT